ncbi:hypothetical protein BO71DRAFT_395413 [Aspergillus ellipticus CBS 707.79]|uniref:Uncharacterized protein n=1 Tax=Aspergillus ellipticus CBS 707.79 TaxID=1448320 RepID=A0A319E3K7_9EURO|nr:hypothetical protein BO71DRAFT_395413 [Aspergillus ellipticus CBS 707.79]
MPASTPSSNTTVWESMWMHRRSFEACHHKSNSLRFACSMSRSIDPRRPYKLSDARVLKMPA